MKKVLSLLLVCAMIFSLALVGYAAGEGYTVTNGTINASTGRFYLNVASKTIAGSGYLTIKYDPEKVTMLQQVKTQTGEDDDGNPVYSTSYVTYESGNFALAQSSCSFADQKADVSKGNVVVQWFNTSKVSAGANVFRIWFEAKDKSGDSFDNTTFTVITNEDEMKALGADMGGPVYVGTDEGDNVLTAEAITWSYKNADVIPGGGDVAATKVVLDKTEATINTIGETVTLIAKVYGADDVEATNQNVTWTTDKESVATVANGVVTAVADGTATITATSEDGNFTATCVITVDADWEAGAATDETAWNNAFKFKDTASSENGKTYEGKKLVIFGKNSTTTALAAESYGVKIGNNEYPGIAEVPAGKAWAIIIIDSNGQKVALDNYSYTAYVGDKTVFSGNVNAQ